MIYVTQNFNLNSLISFHSLSQITLLNEPLLLTTNTYFITFDIMSNADKWFSKQDSGTDDSPEGGDTIDNSYASTSSKDPVPVLKDETPVEQPNETLDPNSDKMLGTILLTYLR